MTHRFARPGERHALHLLQERARRDRAGKYPSNGCQGCGTYACPSTNRRGHEEAVRGANRTFALQACFRPFHEKIPFAFNIGMVETGENWPGEDLASFL